MSWIRSFYPLSSARATLPDQAGHLVGGTPLADGRAGARDGSTVATRVGGLLADQFGLRIPADLEPLSGTLARGDQRLRGEHALGVAHGVVPRGQPATRRPSGVRDVPADPCHSQRDHLRGRLDAARGAVAGDRVDRSRRAGRGRHRRDPRGRTLVAGFTHTGRSDVNGEWSDAWSEGLRLCVGARRWVSRRERVEKGHGAIPCQWGSLGLNGSSASWPRSEIIHDVHATRRCLPGRLGRACAGCG